MVTIGDGEFYSSISGGYRGWGVLQQHQCMVTIGDGEFYSSISGDYFAPCILHTHWIACESLGLSYAVTVHALKVQLK